MTGWTVIPIGDYERMKKATEILDKIEMKRLTTDPWAKTQEYNVCLNMDMIKAIINYSRAGDIEKIENAQPIECKITVTREDN